MVCFPAVFLPFSVFWLFSCYFPAFFWLFSCGSFQLVFLPAHTSLLSAGDARRPCQAAQGERGGDVGGARQPAGRRGDAAQRDALPAADGRRRGPRDGLRAALLRRTRRVHSQTSPAVFPQAEIVHQEVQADERRPQSTTRASDAARETQLTASRVINTFIGRRLRVNKLMPPCDLLKIIIYYFYFLHTCKQALGLAGASGAFAPPPPPTIFCMSSSLTSSNNTNIIIHW